MNNTQKFAELDKLAEGLKGLGTLSDEEFKKKLHNIENGTRLVKNYQKKKEKSIRNTLFKRPGNIRRNNARFSKNYANIITLTLKNGYKIN